MTNSRWKIVLIVTLLNILMEYSIRGINNLKVIPILPLALFLNYFPYFAIIEDLIGRYRLKDYQVAIAALFFCLVWQLLGPSVIYFPPFILGVNLKNMFFVNFVWWVPIQTILAFYIANRIAPRENYGPLLSKRGWIVNLSLFILITLLFRLIVRGFPLPTPMMLLTMLVLITGTAFLFKRMLPSAQELASKPSAFAKSKVLDILSILLTIFLVYSAIFLTSNATISYVTQLNMTALHAVVKVSIIVTIIMIAYRLISKKPIPV